MRKFFHPSNIAVFGVTDNPGNLGKNIISNSLEMGFKGEIYPVGREPGNVYDRRIITDPRSLPEGIDLAVVLIPARFVAKTLEICGQKGIRHAIISTAGFREFDDQDNQAEKDIVNVAKQYGIQFIGPNCIGVICTESGLCTPFNPMRVETFKKGSVGLIAQSGGVTTQCSYHFSEEHLGFSKIISMGNKLNLSEIDFLNYLIHDEDTEQIHMYLESIEDGRALTRLAVASKKPIVIFKSNVSKTASKVAYSHTAALSNDDRIVDFALKQAGIVRVENIHHMTVAAKALQLPPLKGNRLAVISMSGGFSVMLGDACEKYGFKCPPLPRELMDQIEGFRRAGVIRMSNPMDFGDIHDIEALAFALERCMALGDIDGLVFSFLYEPEIEKLFGKEIGNPERILNFIKKMCNKYDKPIALSFLTERQCIEDFKRLNIFPVFNDPVESVRGLHLLRDYWRGK